MKKGEIKKKEEDYITELGKKLRKSYKKKHPEFKEKIKSGQSEEKNISFSEKLMPELLSIAKDNYSIAGNIFYEIISDKKESKATEFLAKFIENNNYIYTLRNDKDTEIWIYKDGIYIQQGKTLIKEQLRKILGSGIKVRLLPDIFLKIELDTMIDIENFFSHFSSKEFLHLIPIKNGLFNINSNKLEPFNPKIIFTTRIPVSYNSNAKCPHIEEFIKDVLEGENEKQTEENIKLFYEIAGFSLYRDYFIEKAVIFDGYGRNGKTKTQELIRNFIGVENSSSVPLSQLTEDSFSISELFNKHINVAGDLSNTNLKDTSTLQKTIGRDRLNAKRKFLTDVKFTNFAKHIFSTNELPKTYTTHRGFWDKWILISFRNTFVEQKEYDKFKTDEEKKNKKPLNPEILKDLITQEELDGLFLKAIQGLNNLRKNKQFCYNTTSEQVKENWIKKSDSFFYFAMENIEAGDLTDDNDIILKGKIRKMYSLFCKDHKLKGCSDQVIKITLQENFGADEYRTHDQRTYWIGIKIKANSKYITEIEKKEIEKIEIEKRIKKAKELLTIN
jgi:putative DNA primase/helicase